MRYLLLKRITSLVFVLAVSVLFPKAIGQVITTAAGGGPNNIPALSAGLNPPRNIAVDSSGNVYVAAAFQVFKITASGQISVLAGNGTNWGALAEGSLATDAVLSVPQAVAVDNAGNVYIGDGGLFSVLKVDHSTHRVSTVADLNPLAPTSLAVDGAGNLFFSVFGSSSQNQSSVIYKIPNGTTTPQVFAGNGTTGFSGDTGPAINAQLSSPEAVTVDSLGNVFIADTGNNRIREVQASTGFIVTVAGNGTAGFSGDGGSPTSAALNGPRGVSLDAPGNIYISDSLNNRIRKIPVSTGLIQTAAGLGSQGFSGDGGLATAAEFSLPMAIGNDSTGDLFIADSTNARIRKITATTQIIQTFAGNGTGFGGDGLAATSSSFTFAISVATDSTGNIFIADRESHVIRKITASTGLITTIAGTGKAGYSGDGGPAINSLLNRPTDVAVDADGNLFIMDNGNQAVREMFASDGTINTLTSLGNCNLGPCPVFYLALTPLGTPMTSAFGGVYINPNGDIFSVDSRNCTVSKELAATSQRVALAGNGTCGYSGDGGPATDAQLWNPTYITGDAGGNIFIADTNNNIIREVLTGTGFIVTIAGSIRGFCGDGLAPRQACLNFPHGLAVDPSGNLWIADTSNARIRKITGGVGAPIASLSTSSLTFSPAVTIGANSPAQSVTLTNQGSASLTISGISLASGNTTDFAQTNTCGTSIPALGSCTIGITFAPTAGGTRAAQLSISDNAPNSPQTVLATGIGADFSFSTTSPSSLSIVPGQTATYNLHLTPSGGFSQLVSLSCAGTPPSSTCSVPASINVDGPVTATVSVSTTAPSVANRTLSGNSRLLYALLILPLIINCVPYSALSKSKCARSLLTVLLVLVSICGCGGGSSNSQNNNGTPKGNYSILVTGTFQSGGTTVNRNITLNLTVQ